MVDQKWRGRQKQRKAKRQAIFEKKRRRNQMLKPRNANIYGRSSKKTLKMSCVVTCGKNHNKKMIK